MVEAYQGSLPGCGQYTVIQLAGVRTSLSSVSPSMSTSPHCSSFALKQCRLAVFSCSAWQTSHWAQTTSSTKEAFLSFYRLYSGKLIDYSQKKTVYLHCAFVGAYGSIPCKSHLRMCNLSHDTGPWKKVHPLLVNGGSSSSRLVWMCDSCS